MSVTSLTPSRAGGSASNGPRIVTQMVIEGHAKRDQDGVSIRMYLKMQLTPEQISLPLIPLFAEENSIRIISTAVHPTDKKFVPYAGGPRSNKLLKHASRALGLDPESSQSYVAVCAASPRQSPPSPSSGGTSSGTLDVAYTGSISISSFSVCFVLPRHFPRQLESESEDVVGGTTPSRRPRRQSLGQRPRYCFMAGLDIYVPYMASPPLDPYLLSMPLPRCLDNKLRLKLFPADVASSGQDNEDGVRWDVSTHPPLNNHRNQTWRNSSISGHAADNDSETSDAGSGGDGDTNIIQGTFYSTDRLRLRWAVPSPPLQPGELHQATWERADARLTIYILQVLWDSQRPGLCKGLRLRLEYSATCKGVHFHGVAALLATDFMLDDRGQGATWADRDDFQNRWDITAGTGLHGIDAGDALTRSNPDSRRTSASSFDDGSIPGTPDIFDGRRSARTSQIPVPAAPSSLLNVPLPNSENVADYSFENHPPTEMMSPSRRSASVMSSASGVSLTTSATGMSSRRSPEPTTVVTLHVNVDQIVPKTRQEKSQFQFEVNGTVDIAAPGSHLSNGDSDDTASDPAQETEFILPLVRLLDVQDERLQITVVTNTGDPILLAPPEPEPGTTSSGSILSRYSSRSSRSRSFKQLSKDKPMTCAIDSRLIVQPAAMPATPIQRDRGLPGSFEAEETPIRPQLGSDLRMPTLDLGGTTVPRTSHISGAIPAVSSSAEGIQTIPWVHAHIEEAASSMYQAVRIRLPAAAVAGHRLDMTLGPSSKELEVNLIYATVAGRPIDSVVHASRGREDGAIDLPGIDSVTWISLDIGGTVPALASDVEFMYRVGPSTIKTRAAQSIRKVPLPSFAVPVAFVRVEVNTSSDIEVHANTDQWDQHLSKAGNIVLMKFSLTDGLTPDVLLDTKLVSQSRRRSSLLGWASIVLVLILVLATAFVQLHDVPVADAGVPFPSSSREASEDPVFVTVTTYPVADETDAPTSVVVDVRQSQQSDAIHHSVNSLSLHSQHRVLAWLRSFASHSMANKLFNWFTVVRGWGMAAVTWPQPHDPLDLDL